MDTPPPIDDFFYPETVLERIVALNEMFPETLRNVVSSTITNTTTSAKWIFQKTRTVSWYVASTAAILILPLSLELERQEFEESVKRQERGILLGPEGAGASPI